MKSLSIQSKIFLLLVLAGVLALVASMITSTNQQKQLAEDTIESNIRLLADNYFDSINTLMLTGTMANREILSTKLKGETEYTRCENNTLPYCDSYVRTRF